MGEKLVGWVPGPRTRGTSDSIWSCISVAFISTWTTLHINVPPVKKNFWWRLRNKGLLMVTGLMAPEYVATLAFTELRAALIVRSSMQELGYEEWTLAHSFFVAMGGYMFYVKGEYKPISAENFIKWQDRGIITVQRPSASFMSGSEKHTEDAASVDIQMVETKPTLSRARPLGGLGSAIELPWISKEDVAARGKADFLLKSIACAQVTWLLVQYIGRSAQSLATSTLEAMTVAYVICALFSYGAWWKKPYDLESPTSVAVPSDHEIVPLLENEPFQIPFNDDPDLPLVSTPWWTFLLPCAAAVLAFSGLHFLAYNYQFSTTIEKWFWRASSIMVVWFHVSFMVFAAYMQLVWKKAPTAASLAKTVFCCEWKVLLHLLRVAKFLSFGRSSKRLNQVDEALLSRCEEGYTPGWVLIAFLVSHTMLYFAARVFVLIEAFTSLRRAPVGLYDTVDWTRFIPHVH